MTGVNKPKTLVILISPTTPPSRIASTTAIIALVASGALPLPSAIAAVLGANIGTTGTIWLAGMFVSDGMPKGDTLRIALTHTGMNLLMAIALLPFVHPIARFSSRF